MSGQLERRWAPATPPPSCTVCSTGRLNSLFALDPEGLESLQREKTLSRYHANQLVYGYGKPCETLYCVTSGTLVEERISLVRGPGRLQFLEAGDMLGWPDFFVGGVHRARAICMTEAILCAVPVTVVRGLIGKNPLLGLKFLGQAMQDLRQSDCESFTESRTAARSRLASALQALTRNHRNAGETGGTPITLPLGRRELADLIAVAPESLSWAIHDLEEAGIAHFSGRTVWINDPGNLSVEIGSEKVPAA